jgi:L-fuconolactonase
MSDRADSHIHLFEGGFQGKAFIHGNGAILDEATSYTTLAKEHGITAALVVGYSGDAWCAQNNAYIAKMAAKHAWVRPVAFVDLATPPNIDQLETWKAQGFVGLSMYIFEPPQHEALHAIDDATWDWLEAQHWLISINSIGEQWQVWLPILARHDSLHIVGSHLGLPPGVAEPPSTIQAEKAIADIATLAQYPGPRVKLSGFYAATVPGYDYPHRAAWPYVEALVAAFGTERLLWGSDFTPSLPWLSFPQTFELFGKMPFLNETDRQRIEGANLLALLADAAA